MWKWIFSWMGLHAHAQMTLIADPSVTSIPVIENHEKFYDLKKQKIIFLGPSPEIPNNQNYTFLRITVYQKLVEASHSLPHGIHFCLYEGLRSLSLQNQLFEAQYLRVKKQHPSWSPQQLFKETTRLVSPVINLDGSDNIPPHSTGGAFDIYLVDEKGHPLDMGIHPKDWIKDKDGKLSQTHSPWISKKAKKNRAIMIKALEKVGFINYPTEYWHWSYGDKYWAYVLNKPNAIYGDLKD